MKYYSKEFRLFLTGLLTGYRKMIEQSLAQSQDSNYHLFANDVKKKIDEAVKILKPTAFNSTDKSFQKLQEEVEEQMQKMEESYQKKEEELRKSLEEQINARVQIAKKEQEDSIRSELAQQFEQEKRTMISVECLPELLQQFFAEKGVVQLSQATQTSKTQKADSTSEESEDDHFDDIPIDENDSLG